MKKILILSAFALIMAVMPSPAYAFNPLQIFDPLCLLPLSCDDQSKQTVVNNVNTINKNTTNSNNTNSTINSNNNNTTAGTPVYVYDNDSNNSSPLGVSCYSNPTSAGVGDTIIWRASAYGGNGNYHITWSGTNGLSGNGTSVSKRYTSEGTKTASVTVTSGSRTISRNCSSVEIYDYDNDNYDNNYDYDDDYYDSRSLSVSCSADTNFVLAGDRVTWRAYVSGGSGSYRYDWDGDENLNGSGKSETITYDRTGVKRASVEVRSGSRTVTRFCTNTVTVGVSNSYNYTYPTQYQTNTNLQIACYPDKTATRIGTPVTWTAEVVGGSGSYAYSWIGTNGLSGNVASVLTSYQSAGTKSATVTVTDAYGRASSQACGSTVYVQGATQTTTVKPDTTIKDNNQNDSDNELSAAALFSVKNIPWGWVMVLVILILIGTIVYLISTRNRIK